MTPKKAAILGGALFVLAMALSAVPAAPGQDESKYKAAELTTAGDVTYPLNTRTPGMVTLDVRVDSSGNVQKLTPVRDVPPLTSAARTAVNTWKFSPATLGRQPIAGVARVNVVFNPFNPGNVNIPNKPLAPPETGGAVKGVFQPPDVQAANYAVYPANTVVSGTVVLDVKVGSDGSIAAVKLRHGPSVLSVPATTAVKNWTFVPATYEGNPVESHEIVVFVFVSPQVGTM